MNRRDALAATGTALTAALGSLALTTLPAATAPVDTAPVYPWERARELAKELASVLNEGDSVWTGPCGDWFAEIYPSAGKEYPITFGSISAREALRDNVSLQMQAAIDAHKQASAALDAACDQTDTVLLGKEPSKAACRRWRKADRAENDALLAVCSHQTYGRADAVAKASYLAPLHRDDALQRHHIAALIWSAVL